MSSKFYSNGDCKKFQPNIFNKIKCTYCFKPKEEHSNEALENNRVTRKAVKCGYLFVAPFSDFSNPINKSKRWQRRWFVLYDDGELKYALDDYPETIPQACIDMNNVLDVKNAEERTSHQFSISIHTPEAVHYVKGTCREEAQWWSDVLNRYKGRKTNKNNNINTTSYSTRISTVSSNSGVWESGDIFPIRERDVQNLSSNNNDNNLTSSSLQTKIYVGSPPTRDKVSTEEKTRLRSSVSRSTSSTSSGIGSTITDGPSSIRSSIKSSTSSSPSMTSSTSNLSLSSSSIGSTRNSSTCSEDTQKISNLNNWNTDKNSSSRLNLTNTMLIEDLHHEKPVRGDPDGCGLDLSPSPGRRRSPTTELRLDLSSTDHYLNQKKGWLMKQSTTQVWNKHWFVLRGCSLLYYRDPKGEEQGVLDGVIALNNITSMGEVQVARNYGFQITTWDSKRTTLSAVTAGIRANWMSAIKRIAGIGSAEDKTDSSSSILQQDSPSTPRSILFSSDDEYRTASEGGRRSSTASDWGEVLPPSPPLIRTPISRVKERASISRSSRLSVSLRSKSSPPSSRRSTLDSVRTEDLTLPCCGELPEPECENSIILNEKLTSSIPLDSHHRLEIDELKVQLNNSLMELTNAEQEIINLKHFKMESEELNKKLKRCEEILKQRNDELNELETYKTRYFTEKSSWEKELNAAEIELVETSHRYEELCRQLNQSRETCTRLRQEFDNCRHLKEEMEERLTRGMEENESLYRRIRELEGNHHSLRESKGRSLDSLSDLTNVFLDLDLDQLDKDRVVEEFDNLRTRFEKAVNEIRIMKKELKESHVENDCLELNIIKLNQELKCQCELYENQTSLMAVKIQDLTLKLTSAEKQIRGFRHKMTKLETRDKRHRSLSLKDTKESLSLCKELEEKLYQLEMKISILEKGGLITSDNVLLPKLKTSTTSPSSGKSELTKRIRRKSLDSINESSTASTTTTTADPMKILFRVTDLEKRIKNNFPSLQQIDENEKIKPKIINEQLLSSSINLEDDEMISYDQTNQVIENIDSTNNHTQNRLSEIRLSNNDNRDNNIDDQQEHSLLLTSIEYEVNQIENIVREHSNNSTINDSGEYSNNINESQEPCWIIDLSNKCIEIKQQIYYLQEYLKQNGGVSSIIKDGGVTTDITNVIIENNNKCNNCLNNTKLLLCENCIQTRNDSDSSNSFSCTNCINYKQDIEQIKEEYEKQTITLDKELKQKVNELDRVYEKYEQLENNEHLYKQHIERLQKLNEEPTKQCGSCVNLEDELKNKENIYIKEMKKLESLCDENFDKCFELENLIKSKDKQLYEEVEKIRTQYEKKINEVTNDYEEEKDHLISIHEEQENQFKEKIRKLETRLGTLDSDYNEELEKLRAAYETSISNTNTDEFLSGTKYKQEMEHIKILCEKGLQAMESTHRRMVVELKQKHSEELEILRQEKEQALKEETEATLAALDVMRKAHDLEVEKKMNALVKRMQSNHDMSALHSQHQAEMEEIKAEIISLSEKYSAKCVESNDLNEKLRHMNKQLSAAQLHISELESRNTKLRHHIKTDSSVTSTSPSNRPSSSKTSIPPSSSSRTSSTPLSSSRSEKRV